MDVIGVGGIDFQNNIARFSSRGMTTWVRLSISVLCLNLHRKKFRVILNGDGCVILIYV